MSHANHLPWPQSVAFLKTIQNTNSTTLSECCPYNLFMCFILNDQQDLYHYKHWHLLWQEVERKPVLTLCNLLITPAGSVSDTSEPSKSTSTSANLNHLLAQFLKVSGFSFSFVFLFAPLMDQHWSQTWYADTIVSICVHSVYVCVSSSRLNQSLLQQLGPGWLPRLACHTHCCDENHIPIVFHYS